jgi:hypothetical protein
VCDFPCLVRALALEAQKQAPVISEHAVKRFVERVESGLSYQAARDRLDALVATAIRMKTRCARPDFSELWWVPDPSCVLVVDRDERGATVATVLSPDQQLSRTTAKAMWLSREPEVGP